MKDRLTLELVTPHNLSEYTKLQHVIMSQPDRYASFGPWSDFEVKVDSDWNYVRFLVSPAGGGVMGTAWIQRIHLCEKAEIGFALLPEYRGKGLGKIVGRLLLRHCFDQLGCQKVESQALGCNPASVMMQKGGMRLEGTQTRSVKVAGVFYDRFWFGLTREEWIARSRIASRSSARPADGGLVLEPPQSALEARSLRRFVLHNVEHILAEGVEFTDRRFAIAWRKYTRFDRGIQVFGSNVGGVESYVRERWEEAGRPALRWLDPGARDGA